MVLRHAASLVVFASFYVFCDVLVSAESLVETTAALKPVPVFPTGANGITCFRIPAAVRTTKGTVLAFAEGRHGSCNDAAVQEIVVRRSTDHGATWSKLSAAVGNASHVVGNPYPIALSSGRVALVYVKHSKHSDSFGSKGSGNGIVWSDDDGLTWSHEQDVSKMFGIASGALPGPGAGVELASGRLSVISHMHNGTDTNDYITYSDDGGQTWTTSGHSFPRMNEGTLADLGGGHVLANMRHAREPTKGRAVARSYDGGLTWSNITYDATLVGPVCQGSLATIGKHLYMSNPANRTSRSHLTIRRSDDGGATWAASLLITAKSTSGYSSLIHGAVKEGKGGILYEAPGGGIDFVLFLMDLKRGSHEVQQKQVQRHDSDKEPMHVEYDVGSFFQLLRVAAARNNEL